MCWTVTGGIAALKGASRLVSSPLQQCRRSRQGVAAAHDSFQRVEGRVVLLHVRTREGVWYSVQDSWSVRRTLKMFLESDVESLGYGG